MSHHAIHDSTATCGRALVGAVWLDSGVVLGLVVVDSNRPTSNRPSGVAGSGSARALRMQFVAARAAH
jgi:hypothetical protein